MHLVLLTLWSARSWSGEVTHDRADVVRVVLSSHPEALAATLEADGAARAIDAAGPVAPLTIEAGVAPLSLMERPGVEVQAAWELPTWGMRHLAREAAGAQAEMVAAEATMTRVELAARASVAVDDLLVARARLEVLDHHLAVLREALGTVQRRVDGGLLPPDASVMASMAVLEVEELRLRAERGSREARAAFTALVGDAVDPDSVVADTTAPDDRPAAGGPPEVAMAEAEARMREAMTTMAGREALPMFEPMVAYSTMWDDPMHRAMVGVMVELPLAGSALRAEKEAAALRTEAARTQRDTASRSAAEASERARAMLDEAVAMEALMTRRMAPLAAERARLARTAWEADRGSLQDWLHAEREVADAALRALEARAEAQRARAMLAMAEGRLAGLPAEAE